MKLRSRKKLAHDRCVAPSQTIAKLEEIMRGQYDYWLHEEAVSEELYWSAMFIEGVDFRSMGKGITAEGSRVGALAEGAESLLALETQALPGYVTASEMSISNALPIASLLDHVASATPPVLEKIRSLDAAYHWVDGYSLIHDHTLKVPIEYVWTISGPNGRATGNNVEEAILHAALEIFERRAQIAVLRNRMVVPTIDLMSIENPFVHRQVAFFAQHGIEIILKDMSFGDALPCIGAYFVDHNIPDDFQFRHFFKVGASFDTNEALLRIFTEYAQGRRKHEFLNPNSQTLESDLNALLAVDFRQLPTQPDDCDNFMSAFMFGLVPYRNADFFREGETTAVACKQSSDDCLDDIHQAISICETLGKDFIVVNLSDPQFDFPVVQVVVPGYSDVLPFHPVHSKILFKRWTRQDALESYRNDHR